MVEQLPTIDISQDEVKLLGALKRELEGHDEGRSDLSENGTLGEGVNDFGARDDVRFADRFEGVDAVRVFFADLHDLWVAVGGELCAAGVRERTDLAKRSFADNLEKLESVDGEGLVLRYRGELAQTPAEQAGHYSPSTAGKRFEA